MPKGQLAKVQAMKIYSRAAHQIVDVNLFWLYEPLRPEAFNASSDNFTPQARDTLARAHTHTQPFPKWITIWLIWIQAFRLYAYINKYIFSASLAMYPIRRIRRKKRDSYKIGLSDANKKLTKRYDTPAHANTNTSISYIFYANIRLSSGQDVFLAFSGGSCSSSCKCGYTFRRWYYYIIDK